MPTVIPAGQKGRRSTRLSPVYLADHLAEAQAAVDAAHREALATLADAKNDALRIRREAHEAGYRQGYAEGRRIGEEQGRGAAFAEAKERFKRWEADLIADMHRIIAELNGSKEDLRIRAEHEVLEFAVALASRLTFAVGRQYPRAAVENLRRALNCVAGRCDVTVRAHPADVEALETLASTVADELRRASAIHCVADSQIAPGGCVVMAGETQVDATLETQLDGIVSLLLGDTGENVETLADEPRAQSGRRE